MLKGYDGLIRNQFLALESVYHCIPTNFQITKTEKVTFLRKAPSQQGQGRGGVTYCINEIDCQYKQYSSTLAQRQFLIITLVFHISINKYYGLKNPIQKLLSSVITTYVLSKTMLSNIVATSHMWLLKFQLIKQN